MATDPCSRTLREPVVWPQYQRPPAPGELNLGRVQGPFDFVKAHLSPYEDAVLTSMRWALVRHLGTGPRNLNGRLSVKLRCVDLQAGEHPCNPGWHIDSVESPWAPGTPEQHVLFVTGDPLTEFISGEVVLSRPLHTKEDIAEELAWRRPMVRAVPPCSFALYSRDGVHRCQSAAKPTRRLLMRLTWDENRVELPREKVGR